jgi:hypothetical protein
VTPHPPHPARASRRWVALPVAAAGLVLAWLVAPAAPPLYDGVGFPDEPYRYVSRPAGNLPVTQPPGAVARRMPVVSGDTTDGFNSSSDEQGPQISVFVPTGTLRAPKGAHSILLRAEPRAPDGPADGGTADGNVYRITATSDAGSPSVAATADKIEVIIRATTARQPGPVMEYRKLGARSWTRLPTSRYGNDVYAAAARGFGDYALVFAHSPPGASRPASRTGASRYTFALIVAGLILLLGAAVIGIRVARTRRAT